jgi:hypothetical protein
MAGILSHAGTPRCPRDEMPMKILCFDPAAILPQADLVCNANELSESNAAPARAYMLKKPLPGLAEA